MSTIITKEVGFDMGHRVPNHKSKCRNPHGHRYTCEIALEGELVDIEGASDEGMVMDFSDVKRILQELTEDVLDHGFMYYEGDKIMADFFGQWGGKFRAIKVPFIPTAENISRYIFEKLDPKFKDIYDTKLMLKSVTLWETPTSKAIYTRD